MGSCASDPAILKSWRKTPPPSSSLVRLSQLANDKYESPPFSSGGHNWRLVVYPKGNEEDNGRGFVSIEEEKKYLSIQDVEVKRFNSSKTVWGLSQALSVETLKDRAKGFILYGEEHEFGAHVKIALPPVPVDLNLPFHKFSWSIRDFSCLKQNDCVSKTFHMGEKNWTLTLYPKGDSETDGQLHQNLLLADGETLMRGEMIFVRVQLQVLDPHGSNHLTESLTCWVMASTRAYGLPQSMPCAKIQEAYLDREDTLKVEIECEVVKAIKNNPFF
ncbi:unnamed protein product [Arabidopsis lyrata]|nr:unnamed protein product [Arabidopsis lyrata]